MKFLSIIASFAKPKYVSSVDNQIFQKYEQINTFSVDLEYGVWNLQKEHSLGRILKNWIQKSVHFWSLDISCWFNKITCSEDCPSHSKGLQKISTINIWCLSIPKSVHVTCLLYTTKKQQQQPKNVQKIFFQCLSTPNSLPITCFPYVSSSSSPITCLPR